ncbi:GNAT family N-acetyltransferase [Terrabacter terrigena]|uniref:GNAT family N-acetyltransferase n=1 Tax=Terrabacter terrigena TaxID=574718 RepID=A0ABW3MYR2_9MICO
MTRDDRRAWDAAAVLAASNAWSWVPDGAPHVANDEYLVVAYPQHFLTPTSARVFGSERDAAALADEICAVARGWGRDRLWWRLSEFTQPQGLEPELMTRGAGVVDRMDVLALSLDEGLPDLAVPGDVSVRRVTDEQTVRDAITVGNDAFGGADPTDDQVASALLEVERGLDDDSSGRWVAYVDGRPAGTGGYTLAGDVCRLWGGGTHSSLRGRGAYRAVLDARLRAAKAAGATLGLTHGVVGTSSPILRRTGFTRYGEERTLVLDLAPS